MDRGPEIDTSVSDTFAAVEEPLEAGLDGAIG